MSTPVARSDLSQSICQPLIGGRSLSQNVMVQSAVALVDMGSEFFKNSGAPYNPSPHLLYPLHVV